ncbi:host cell division inhibitor Icd-like protein [Pseudescherichia sp.]|uniref:host cell division inhibitor Icd-like protein n=1 Tax=Pseudescherichia sp. TaxID=2055881 RepID=UPI00289FBC51|nr:host cell division inhibitor Icd-like protein [Pseudescherichia sp.]
MLTLHPRLTHHSKAPAYSGVPDWRLVNTEGDKPAATRGFLLSKISTPSMVGLVVELLTKHRKPSVPVRQSAISLTTRRLASFGGDVKTSQKEIASMAINAQSRLKTFIFAAVERANLKSSRPVMLHITAATERLARQSASRQYVLSFAGVIQNGEAL